MEKKVTKGKWSFYDIELVLTADDYAKSKEKVLKNFQKDLDLPGFRKGFVPIHLVEEHVQPEYVSLGIYEHLVNKGLQEIVGEKSDIKFIGEPYDIKQDKKGDDTIVTLKLDTFPEVVVKDDWWSSLSIKSISSTATKEEIDEAMLRLKKNYADYKDTDVVTKNTISKVSMKFLDKDKKELDTWTLYVGEQEFEESPFFEKTFVDKKKWETFVIPYKEKDLPPTLQSKKSDSEPKDIELVITDIKEMVLPEINDETLTKLFWKDSQVKNESELLKYIEDSIAQQKFDSELVKTIEDFLKKVQEKYMEVSIPKSLLDQEVRVRVENLEKRFGGKDKMETYFKQMWEEKSKSFIEDMASAAKESLEKFFILQKISEELKLDINWDKPVDLEVEKKLYDKLVEKKGADSTAKKTPKKSTK